MGREQVRSAFSGTHGLSPVAVATVAAVPATMAMGFGMANQMINQGMLTGQTTPPAGGAPVQAAASPGLLTPAQVAQQLAKGEPTIPVTIGEEKKANVFLRADVPGVAEGIGMAGKEASQVFTEIRARKNKF